MEKSVDQNVYTVVENNGIRCEICPQYCLIKPRRKGLCNSKFNKDGKLYTIYGAIAYMAVDFIERNPLFHFWPGTQTLCIACPSCNFTCPWCINWDISQSSVEGIPEVEYLSIETILAHAREWGCKSISYTFTEPAVWYDFVLDVAREANKIGLLNVLNTNGYMSPKIVEKICPYIDAANVDIKSFSDEFYRKYCGGRIKPVLETAKRLKEFGIHIEIAMLIIPGLNDDPNEIRLLSRWIKEELGRDTPLIFERFFPHYKYLKEFSITPTDALLNARRIAMDEGLNYAYVWGLGPVESEAINTYCPECKRAIIHRIYFEPYMPKDWKLARVL